MLCSFILRSLILSLSTYFFRIWSCFWLKCIAYFILICYWLTRIQKSIKYWLSTINRIAFINSGPKPKRMSWFLFYLSLLYTLRPLYSLSHVLLRAISSEGNTICRNWRSKSALFHLLGLYFFYKRRLFIANKTSLYLLQVSLAFIYPMC
jgi:hypothetical protein